MPPTVNAPAGHAARYDSSSTQEPESAAPTSTAPVTTAPIPPSVHPPAHNITGKLPQHPHVLAYRQNRPANEGAAATSSIGTSHLNLAPFANRFSEKLKLVNWENAERIRVSTKENVLEHGYVDPMHVVNAQIIRCANESASELGLEISERTIGEILGAALKTISQEDVTSWPPEYQTAALTFAASFQPKSVENAFASLERTFHAVPALQGIPWHRRWEFIIDTQTIDTLNKKFDIHPNPFMIALYDGGVLSGNSKDDAQYAELWADALEKCLVTDKDRELSGELFKEIHDKASPMALGISEDHVGWTSRYTEDARAENMAIIKYLDSVGVKAAMKRLPNGAPQHVDADTVLSEPWGYGRVKVPKEELMDAMDAITDDMKTAVAQAGEDKSVKAAAIFFHLGILQKLHPFKNGNHRVFGQMILLRLQVDYDLPPSLIGMAEFEILSSAERVDLSDVREGHVQSMKESQNDLKRAYSDGSDSDPELGPSKGKTARIDEGS